MPAPIYTLGDFAPLTPQETELIQALQGLEPAFVRASQLALTRQATIVPEQKLATGNPMVDVVTAADREVQHELVASLLGTPLQQCRLLAEETLAPEHEAAFDRTSHLVLSLDPIDGTRRYTEKKPWFSTIIGLHNGVRPLYSFVYYPALGWWIRIRDTVITTAEQPLPRMLEGSLTRTVVYTAGRPQDEIQPWVDSLSRQGIDFAYGESVAACGSKMLVLSGLAGGYFCARPNAYDGLFGLHYGLASKRPVLAWGGVAQAARQALDLRQTVDTPSGVCYAGGYLVLPHEVHLKDLFEV